MPSPDEQARLFGEIGKFQQSLQDKKPKEQIRLTKQFIKKMRNAEVFTKDAAKEMVAVLDAIFGPMMEQQETAEVIKQFKDAIANLDEEIEALEKENP